MATVATTIDQAEPAETASETMADVIERLGGIPAERILMRPVPGTATEEDVVKTQLCELIDGTIVAKTRGLFESVLGLTLADFFQTYLDEQNRGFVVGADCHLRFGAQVREPDVAFVSWDRLPGGEIPDTPVGEVTPDLAVDILKRDNTIAEFERKKREYFAHGVRLVWIADPPQRIVEVWNDVETCRTLGEDGVLDGGDILPSFTLPVREWFERTERRLRKGNP